MCRLFGFRSITDGQVHQSLIHAENALEIQSVGHPDGWGLCYYLNNCPHLIKSEKTAIEDSIFKQVSGVVSSDTVVAHLRKATAGRINLLNTHPFQYGNWTFAHNGNIKNFSKHRNQIVAKIVPELRRFILGETDSEVIFFFLLSSMNKVFDINSGQFTKEIFLLTVKNSIKELTRIIGNCSAIDECGPDETYLTFILTDGKNMIGHQGGKHLHFSTYKNSCKERDTCNFFSPECEAASTTGKVNHLLFSSEPLSGDNVWTSMHFGQFIVIDGNMNYINS